MDLRTLRLAEAIVLIDDLRKAGLLTAESLSETVPCHPAPPPAAPGSAATPPSPLPLTIPPDSRWLSPLSERIVVVLTGAGWLTADEIGAKLERAPDSRFRGILWDMVERNILESDNRKGYRLRPVPGEPHGQATS
jgi:hypothetical protein